MHDVPRQKLHELLATYGRSLCDDPRRCEGLLRDVCGDYRPEIHVLVGALTERIVSELLAPSASRVPHEVLLARLTKKLQGNLGLADDAACWAVESWALALGVISSPPARAPDKRRPAQKQRASRKPQDAQERTSNTAQQRNLPAEEKKIELDRPPIQEVQRDYSQRQEPLAASPSVLTPATLWTTAIILAAVVLLFFALRDTPKTAIQRQSVQEILATPAEGPRMPQFQGFPEDDTEGKDIQHEKDLADFLATEVLPHVIEQSQEAGSGGVSQ